MSITRGIRQLGVLGAGQMGTGIAYASFVAWEGTYVFGKCDCRG